MRLLHPPKFAEGETRTPTTLQPQRPERCVSTNSTTPANFGGQDSATRAKN